MNKYKLTNIFLPTVILICVFIIGCGGDETGTNNLKQAGLEALESGRFMKAVEIFRSALKEKPSDRDFLYYLGISYKRLDMFDSAVVYFQRARVLYKRDREINQELVELCPLFGDYQCAIDAVAVLVATGDNEKMYWALLADLYYRNKEKQMAVNYYKLVLNENPEQKNTYILLSGTLTEIGKFQESNDFLELYLEKFSPAPEIYANMAMNYLSLEQFDKAEEYFRASLALQPENVPIWINLAHVLTIGDNKAKKSEALEIYRKYYEQTPKFYNLDSIITALEEELSQ